MNRKIKIMLVEDNPEYRRVIEIALKRDDGLELVNQSGTAERALRSLQDMSTRNVPDLILLDLNLPGMSGLEALPHFAKAVPDSSIIVLTQSDNEADVLKAISLGAKGYLLKSATVQQIKDGIKTVVEGGSSLSPAVACFILNKLKTKLSQNQKGDLLSERELETLKLLGDGLQKKEIADQLGISTFTVATHIRHIYEKLEVPNAPAAVNRAHRLGLFPKDD
ncbi:Oxygen regulatory protein NreC [Pontiella desulfatans]|uniref:Oxygen regulatory protein NreC n=1 Tax=Pontiella desulfatans TaxID=2750659 RepID=A0A6C2TX78_PONDE|nr:response regulator transcription factor [Pontiella desulfatans]VGO12219.1 Oxygen regulatory protein NreC [Pontiella desulfatans]